MVEAQIKKRKYNKFLVKGTKDEIRNLKFSKNLIQLALTEMYKINDWAHTRIVKDLCINYGVFSYNLRFIFKEIIKKFKNDIILFFPSIFYIYL